MLDIIRKRRSIRQYKKKLPEDAEIRKVLEAGRWAPSGLNNQPWRFLVIRDQSLKDGLAKFTEYSQIIKEAPIIIVVCMNIADSYNRDKDLMAIGACIQNMLLQAHSIGLATCWLGEILNKKRAVCQYLKLDKKIELMAVISVGYQRGGSAKSSRKSLDVLLIRP